MEDLGILDLMLPAFCECLVLVGIHSYLGLHVIRRKVIFVDLALAQVAALGTTVGFLFGMAPDSIAAFIFSVLFTFIAAAVFSVARLRNDRVPQEAIIGLVYAIAAAVVILVIDLGPHGAEHIKEVMTGTLLWVQWESIIFAAVTYAFIGVIHILLADKFLLISNDPTAAYERGMRVRLWDFLFYMTFGVVIAISVRTAGVLLVFVFLVVPAITATLITEKLKWQLAIGWTMGVVVTVIGLGLSYVADLPSGPTVVSFYGVMLVIAAVAIYLARHRSMGGLLRVAAGAGIVGAVLLLIVFGGRALGSSSLAQSRTHVQSERDHTAHTEGGHGEHGPGHGHHGHGGHGGGGGDEVERFLRELGQADEEDHPRIADELGDESREVLTQAFERADEGMLKLSIARQMARLHGPAEGGAMMLQVVREAEAPFAKDAAASALEGLAGREFGYQPGGDEEDNAEALAAMEAWVESAGE